MHDPAHQEALLAAQHLFAAVFHHHDTRAFEAEAECFVPEGVWTRKDEELKGRAAIVATLRRRPQSLITMHVVSNVVVHRVWGDRVEATFYLTTYSFDDGRIHDASVGLRRFPSVGIGRATLLCENGRWGIEQFATNDWKFQWKLSAEVLPATK